MMKKKLKKLVSEIYDVGEFVYDVENRLAQYNRGQSSWRFFLFLT